jgi:DNA-binding transcriptional MerR regulator
MGLRLADIKELLDVRDHGCCPCGHTEALVDKRLAEVEAEIARLSGVRSQLRDLGRRNGQCLEVTADEWWSSMEQKGGDD